MSDARRAPAAATPPRGGRVASTHRSAGELPDEEAFAREFPGASLLASRTARTLEVVGAQIEARIATLCRGYGLSHAALNALAVIEGRGEPCTPGDVAAAMHMTSGSMTSLIDTLVRNGWAARSADDEDRRKVRIEITPVGEQLLDEVLPQIQSLVGALLQGLSERQQRTLVDLLEKASASMTAFTGEPPPAAPRNKPRRR